MSNNDKIFLVLAVLLIPVFLFGFNIQTASAVDNSALIAQLQQEIASLIKQIIALLQQEAGISANNNLPVQPAQTGISTQIQSNTQINNQTQSQTQAQNRSGGNSQTATLTVNASGVTAYVSINGGAQFAYTSSITLNNGDTYSVTASQSSGGSGNSTSKCSGTASSGGSYVCNITIN